MNILEKLFSLQDLEYKAFHIKLMPTVSPENVIGIRIPVLRRLAKEIKNTDEGSLFLKKLPHKYYEENNLHAFLIEGIDDFDSCVAELERFLPYVDNWATCDSMRPKCFKKNKDKLLLYIEKWLKSDSIYTVRFAVECLMIYFLDESFDVKYLEMVSQIKSEEYYVNMMIAWYFATALAKQWTDAVRFLENNRLSPWVHNKTIQKAVESYRITGEQKAYLKTLKNNYTVKVFEYLPDEAMDIRIKVFVDEQGFYDEIDDTDKFAKHIVLYDNGKAISTCRVFPYGEGGVYALGRLCVLKSERGKKIGSRMLKEAENCVLASGGNSLILHSQYHARDFYKKSGYSEYGEMEYEQHCPHIWMKKELINKMAP